MTSTADIPIFALDAKRRWAAEQFDATGESDDVPIGNILAHLADEEFVPGGAAREAIRTLTSDNDSAATDPLGEYVTAREMNLSEQIESLAGEFFKLSIADRARRVEELLADEALSAPQRARLNELSGAVYFDLRPSEFEDPRESELAGLALELFVLPPIVRSCRVRQELARMQSDGAAWSAAARRLQRDRELGRLLPRFLRDVSELDPARIEDRRIEQRKKLGLEGNRIPDGWSMTPVASSHETAAAVSGGGGSYAWVFVIAAIAVIRLVSTLDDRPTSSPSPPRNYSPSTSIPVRHNLPPDYRIRPTPSNNRYLRVDPAKHDPTGKTESQPKRTREQTFDDFVKELKKTRTSSPNLRDNDGKQP